jgi:hypothetical protein
VVAGKMMDLVSKEAWIEVVIMVGLLSLTIFIFFSGIDVSYDRS